MFAIHFSDDAGESFLSAVTHLSGWTVTITPYGGGERFDAVIRGGDWDGETYEHVLVRRLDPVSREPIGGGVQRQGEADHGAVGPLPERPFGGAGGACRGGMSTREER